MTVRTTIYLQRPRAAFFATRCVHVGNRPLSFFVPLTARALMPPREREIWPAPSAACRAYGSAFAECLGRATVGAGAFQYTTKGANRGVNAGSSHESRTRLRDARHCTSRDGWLQLSAAAADSARRFAPYAKPNPAWGVPPPGEAGEH
jgi:hypothetical protein